MEIKLKNVRIAFCQHLFVAGAISATDKPAFSSTFILQKDDPQNASIKKVIEAVAVEKWAAKSSAILKSLMASGDVCYRDGDTKAQYDGFEGNMYISSRSKSAPGVFDRDRSPLTEASGKPYAGCYVNVSLDVWAQDNNFGKRINTTLKGVQFFGDGDAFVGSAPATSDDFDDVSDTGENADDLV
jgi:hypothetical protein